MFIKNKNLERQKLESKRGLVFSGYQVPEMIPILNTLPKENYILGVTYKEGDSQIMISGHLQDGETEYEAAQREMTEELALNVKYKNAVTLYNENTFVVDIKDCKISNDYTFPGKDTKEKVIICVHGEYRDVLNYLKKVNLNENLDGITDIWMVKVKELLEDRLRKRGTRREDNNFEY